MKLIRIYDEDKLNALASFLSISVDQIQVWSDNSLTVKSGNEYYVTKGRRTYDRLIGRKGVYNIYQSA